MQNPPPLTAANKQGDDAVRGLLRDAFPDAPIGATPGFRSAVWQRISERTCPLTWPQWLRGHLIGVSAATAICALAAVAGGGWIALEQNRLQRQQQIMSYVSSIDAHRQLAVHATANPSLPQTHIE